MALSHCPEREFAVWNENTSVTAPSRRPIVQRRPLTVQVAAEIAARILAGELPPGTLLKQEQLSEELEVSRTPLREALRELLADGLVTQGRNGTFAVVSPTFEDAWETYEMRAVIDPFVARKAAERATDEQIAELERLVLLLEEACETPFDSVSFLAAANDYQCALLRASGNRALLPLENTIRMSTRLLYPRFLRRKDRLIASAKEHRKLFEAIRSRKPELAERLAARHLRKVMEFWSRGDRAEPE